MTNHSVSAAGSASPLNVLPARITCTSIPSTADCASGTTTVGASCVTGLSYLNLTIPSDELASVIDFLLPTKITNTRVPIRE
jgi:hypothetical protein